MYLPQRSATTASRPPNNGHRAARIHNRHSSIEPEMERNLPGSMKYYHRPMRDESVKTSRQTPNRPLAVTTDLRAPRLNDSDTTGIIPIGMAVESPTQPRESVGTAWQSRVTTVVTASPQESQEESRAKEGLSRSKSRKWGIFGRSKSKRVKNIDQAVAVSQEHTINSNLVPTRTASAATSARERRHGRTKDLPLSNGIGRSYTSPATVESPWLSPATSKHQMKPAMGVDEHKKPESPRNDNTVPSEPLLDVEIPNVALDRYSVMFASLLQRRSTAAPAARRHGFQDALQTLREEETDEKQESQTRAYRGTSGSGSDLPRVPGSYHDPAQRFQPLSSHRRPSTSSAVETTTIQNGATGAAQPENEMPRSTHIVRLASVKAKSPTSHREVAIHGPDRTKLRSKFHVQSPTLEASASKSSLSLSSPIETSQKTMQEGGGLSPPPKRYNNNKFVDTAISSGDAISRPKLNVSIPLQRAAKSPPYTYAASQASLSVSLSSLSDEEPDEDHQKAIEDAVNVSIARQISVSREQRRMLRPLQMHPVEEPGMALADTKSSTPRFVNPLEDCSSPIAAHRRSELVVLERA